MSEYLKALIFVCITLFFLIVLPCILVITDDYMKIELLTSHSQIYSSEIKDIIKTIKK